MRLANWVRRFLGRTDGSSTAEYALLAGLLVLAAGAAMWALGPAAGSQVGSVGTAVGTPADP